ncbi:MAG: hypothetical protein ACFFED_11205 [Candidatus Thorarchaeota archaeon]
MKKQFRIAIIVAIATAVLFLASTTVLGFPGQTGACDASGCHDSPGSMSISASPNSVTVEIGEQFSVVISVTGESGENTLVVKFPSSLVDNNQFDYASLDAEGRVEDGDPLDTNAATDAVEVNYTITAPTAPGTYTLRVYGAQHTPLSINTDITVTVSLPAGPGPSINMINGTPSIPLNNEPVLVVVNVTSETATISYVRLQYTVNNGSSWTNVSMTLDAGLYSGEIPGQPDDTYVIYRVVAGDDTGEETVSWELDYRVGDIPIPPPEPTPQLHYGWLLGAPALVLAYLGTALEYYDEEKYTRAHGIMLGLAYILTSINVCWLFFEDPSVFTAMDIQYLINPGNIIMFVHSWHIWLGIISMILGTLAFITHLGGWKTCNLGLPAVVLWTILGFTGMYLGLYFRMG